MSLADALARASAVKAEQINRLRRKLPLSWTATTLFAEQDVALRLAEKLGSSCEGEEQNILELEVCLKPCQERPQSLDQILSTMARSLIRRPQSASAARGLYLLCKIRGRKAVSKVLPSNVEKLEECLQLLQSTHWEVQYVGLVWLSTLVLIPFNLDSVLEGSNPIDNLIEACEKFLQDGRATREPASLCIARLLSRPDCTEHLTSFLSKANANDGVGYRQAIAEVFKRPGDNIAAHANEFLPVFLDTAEDIFLHPSKHSSLQRKLELKVIQRTFTATTLSDTSLVERVLGLFIGSGLSDLDSIVRWSAAKGVGRICDKLRDPDLQNQVCESVISLFDDLDKTMDDDTVWHGASLAMAELARRRLLVAPDLVQQTVETCIGPALEYDRKRGTRVLGPNVRDAACYVCWALVRVVKPEVIAPFVDSLYRDLVLCSLFDREVTCRRAAAAALQECVGRLGRTCFPRGIETIQILDYQSIGNIQRSYTEFAVKVARLKNTSTIFKDMVEHLVMMRSVHWDETIRLLASQALGSLLKSQSASEFSSDINTWTFETLLARVTPNSNRVQLHGTLFCLAETLECFSEEQRVILAEKVLVCIQTTSVRQFDEVRAALCAAVEAISRLDAFKLGDRPTLDAFLQSCLADDSKNNKSPDENLKRHARMAFVSLLVHQHLDLDSTVLIQDACTKLKVPFLHAVMMTVNQNKQLFHHSTIHSVSHALGMALDVGKGGLKYTDRVEALEALGLVVDDDFERIVSAILVALDDYQVTNQGDVGSWVRRQACKSISTLASRMAHSKNTSQMSLSSSSWHRVRDKCAFLACDKLDHVREAALEAISHFIPHLVPVHAVMKRPPIHFSFEICARMLEMSSVRAPTIKGLVITAGSLSESPSSAAKDALLTFINTAQSWRDLAELWDVLLQAIRENAGVESRLVPVLKTCGWLLLDLPQMKTPPSSVWSVWMSAMLDQIRRITAKTKSVARLDGAGRVLVGLGASGFPPAWRELGRFLTHAFPVVRKQTREAFYLWGIGILSPEESLFDREGGQLEAALNFVSDESDILDDDRVTTQQMMDWLDRFMSLCPKTYLDRT